MIYRNVCKWTCFLESSAIFCCQFYSFRLYFIHRFYNILTLVYYISNLYAAEEKIWEEEEAAPAADIQEDVQADFPAEAAEDFPADALPAEGSPGEEAPSIQGTVQEDTAPADFIQTTEDPGLRGRCLEEFLFQA